MVPLGAPLVAEIRGADLHQRLDDATFASIERAWLDHKALRLRGQPIDDDALADRGRRFGPLDEAPIARTGRPHQPSRP